MSEYGYHSSREFRRPQISVTKNLPFPTEYVTALENECAHVAFSEERAPRNQGLWRSQVFNVTTDTPMDVEIGTGNGTHFRHHVTKNPGRCLVGLELKYKPLIQTIRSALREGCKNAAICRYHAMNIDLLFSTNEINDVYIHFPDPWVSPRKPRNRFVNRRVLGMLAQLQRPGSQIEFKTDSREYFDWAMEEIKESSYKIIYSTFDLHNSEKSVGNVITTFERIFMRKNIPINYVLLQK